MYVCMYVCMYLGMHACWISVLCADTLYSLVFYQHYYQQQHHYLQQTSVLKRAHITGHCMVYRPYIPAPAVSDTYTYTHTHTYINTHAHYILSISSVIHRLFIGSDLPSCNIILTLLHFAPIKLCDDVAMMIYTLVCWCIRRRELHYPLEQYIYSIA